MAAQTREKSTENGKGPASAVENNGSGSDSGAANDVMMEGEPHPLASVLGSFRDDLASLDAIMAAWKNTGSGWRRKKRHGFRTPRVETRG